MTTSESQIPEINLLMKPPQKIAMHVVNNSAN